MIKAQAYANLEREFKNGKIVEFYEPCNCGSQIQHHNGGNYHQFLQIKKVDESYFLRWDDTCELKPDEPFFEVGKLEYLDALNYAHRMGWGVTIQDA